MVVKNKFSEFSITTPGAGYSEHMRAWQGVPSVTVTPGGRLYVVFMSGGIYEPDPRNCGIVIYSDNSGDTWSAPVLVLESQPEKRIRISDPELWTDPDGCLWMFWAECPWESGLPMPDYDQKIDMENDSEYHRLEADNTVWCSVCNNPDAEETIWSEPRRLFHGQMRNHPFITDSGRWLFPAYITAPREKYEVFCSDDKGKTFFSSESHSRAPGRAYDEPCFWKMGDGRIGMLVRTVPPVWKRLTSSDNGKSWSDAEPYIDCASQRPCIANLRNGMTVMITSIHQKLRNGLQLMISDDGSDTWSRTIILDDRERVSYPEIAEGDDGTLYIVYDRERNNKIRKSLVTGTSEAAKEILFARIPPDVLKTGVVNNRVVRAKIISKAGISDLNNIYTDVH